MNGQDRIGQRMSMTRGGTLAALFALLAGTTFLMTADSKPANAQFGISIGGFGMGGGGYGRGGRPSYGRPGRMPGMGGPGMQRVPRMGGADRYGGRGMANPTRMGDHPRGGGRVVGYPGRWPSGDGMGRPGRPPYGDSMGRPGRPPYGEGRPGRPPYGESTGRPPRYPPGGGWGRPGRWPPGGPIIAYPPRGPRPPDVVLLPDDVPPAIRRPRPGGGGPPIIRRPPGGGGGGGMPPGRTPPGAGGGGGGRGPAATAAAAGAAALALVSTARAAGSDVPGLPPRGETRYVPDEVLFVMRADAPQNAVQSVVRRFNLTLIDTDASDLVGTVVHRYRVPRRMSVPAAIRAMTRAPGVAYAQPNYVFDRPNYVFRLQSAAATGTGGAALQYVIDQLRLPEAHRLARGERVPIAVIDSGVDQGHPEMTGRISKAFDAVGGPFQPHEHGTGMAGAIVAHAQLTGISPRADILAARAFAPGERPGASGTSYHILKSMDWSVREGARVINMSFAGPRDPMMTRAIARAAERRIAMIAAMGNEGPRAPVSFPAADPNVIAVTAVGADGRLFEAASRGNHVAVAAPGIDILLPAPSGGYQISSGTSVAAAHVSGIAALLLERSPDLDPAQLRQLLQQTARRGQAADPQLGAGLADPVPALTAVAGPAPAPPPVAAAPPQVTTAPPPPPPGMAETGAADAEPRQATVETRP